MWGVTGLGDGPSDAPIVIYDENGNVVQPTVYGSGDGEYSGYAPELYRNYDVGDQPWRELQPEYTSPNIPTYDPIVITDSPLQVVSQFTQQATTPTIAPITVPQSIQPPSTMPPLPSDYVFVNAPGQAPARVTPVTSGPAYSAPAANTTPTYSSPGGSLPPASIPSTTAPIISDAPSYSTGPGRTPTGPAFYVTPDEQTPVPLPSDGAIKTEPEKTGGSNFLKIAGLILLAIAAS